MLRIFEDVIVKVSRVKQLAQGQRQQIRQIVIGHGVHQHLDRVNRLARGAAAIHGQRLREPRAVVTCRDAEVAELEDAVRAEQEVLRLHIAVDQTGGVDGGEPGAHLRAERRGFGRRQLPALRDELGERPPLHVLHRDEGTAVVLADVEDAHDVRVREPRRQACLAEKAPL